MATSAVDGMMLLMKKLGGLVLVFLGCLVLKIVRRNPD
jgi:hypothetical protein